MQASSSVGNGDSLLGVDVVLEVTLEGFDGGKVQHKHQVIAERRLPLPVHKESTLVDSSKVPVNGKVTYKLAVHEKGERIIDEAYCEIRKHHFLVHHIKGIYNSLQKVVTYIPVIGKVLEKIIPDAKQKVDVVYSVRVGTDRKLSYRVLIGRAKKPKRSIVSEGEFQL